MNSAANDLPEFSARRIADEYMTELGEILDRMDFDAISRAVERLRAARDRGATIFIAGNGGSAATASHLVNDLGKATKQSGRPALRVMCLSDNVSWLTALANDEGYDRVFTGQLENFARPDDVLILISASGNSPNLLHVERFARERGVETIGIVGFDGGRLRDTVDEAVWLESKIGSYGPVETGHTVICDILTTCLIHDVVPEAGGGAGS